MIDIYQLKKRFYSELKGVYPMPEIESFFYLLATHILKMSRVELALSKTIMKKEEVSFFNNAIKELQKHKPIQYIIGSTSFFNLPFSVTEDVLIPRPETEELVNWILHSINEKSKLQILDIGTGSGCIAVSLAKNTQHKVYALDVSGKALQVAQKNAKLNKVEVTFVQKDILKTTKLLNIKFDVIVSNPPYVRDLEKKAMQKNVLQYEPYAALFVDDNNPLLFYDKIADFAKKNLTPNGILFFEINQYLGKETVQLLKEKGFSNIVLRKDFYENDRMIQAKL